MNWPDWLICTLHAGEYLDVMLEAGCKKEVVEDRCASDFAPFFWAAWHPCSPHFTTILRYLQHGHGRLLVKARDSGSGKKLQAAGEWEVVQECKMVDVDFVFN